VQCSNEPRLKQHELANSDPKVNKDPKIKNYCLHGSKERDKRRNKQFFSRIFRAKVFIVEIVLFIPYDCLARLHVQHDTSTSTSVQVP